jgi:hypothetical protein
MTESGDTKWLIRKFLEEQERIRDDVGETVDAIGRWLEDKENGEEIPDDFPVPPMHVLNNRLALVDMVLTEVDNDNLGYMAVRGLAEETRNLCLAPANPQVICGWQAALRWFIRAC